MYVGAIKLTIHISHSQSLKDKRRVVKSLCGKIKSHFNVAVAEVDPSDKWQIATIGISSINTELKSVSTMRDKVMAFIEQSKMDFAIVDQQHEVIQVT